MAEKTKSEKIPYLRHYPFGFTKYKRLNLTGKWKRVKGIDPLSLKMSDSTNLYYQHQGLFFKRWILVDDIYWFEGGREEYGNFKKREVKDG